MLLSPKSASATLKVPGPQWPVVVAWVPEYAGMRPPVNVTMRLATGSVERRSLPEVFVTWK